MALSGVMTVATPTEKSGDVVIQHGHFGASNMTPIGAPGIPGRNLVSTTAPFSLSRNLDLGSAVQGPKALLVGSSAALRRGVWNLWESKRIRRLRKKLEFEFFTLILGSGGNSLCLMIFWPGWAIVALVVLLMSICAA
ncbi:hypothetical protein F4780DRAFT_173490 [Xylariomycetidae sp. FL0641]|nr:hypothetical protein F4780DRAFT_173490 [Xylariomycetidae sp. FL0641]